MWLLKDRFTTPKTNAKTIEVNIEHIQQLGYCRDRYFANTYLNVYVFSNATRALLAT